MAKSWANSGIDLHLELPAGSGRRAGLEGALREAIRDGRLSPGTRLPASRALASELGLARGTVTSAYDQLVAEGFLVAGQGSGTTVAALEPRRRRRTPHDADAPAGLGLDLTPGSPDVASFPTAMWMRATRRALGSASARTLDYSDPRGLLELRSALAEYLGRTRGVVATPEDIIVTSGYVQALALLASAVGTGPVAMENPNLLLHRNVVRHQGRDVLSLSVDDRGARSDQLVQWASSRRSWARCDLAVVTPAHQFPLGVPLSPERRHAIVTWAREHDALVVEDDYDGEFRYDRQPVGALQGMAPDHVAYIGTASKTLAPGVRLGWLVLPRRVADGVVTAKLLTDLHTSAITQLTLAELIRSHDYDRQVRAMRLRYRRRRDLLLAVLEQRTGRYARSLVPQSIAAGLQTVIRLPDEGALIRRAADLGLALSGLAEHFHSAAGRTSGIVVGFAKPTEGAYPRALETLAQVLP